MEHVSATSIRLFQNCQRRWYERYILGKKEESTVAMKRGNEVHRQLEEYLQKGTLPDDTVEGQIAVAGLQYLPSPDPNHQVEQSLDDYPVPNVAIRFKGFIDLLSYENGVLEVLDHKTTSNFRYALSGEQLKQDTQMVIYARHVLEHYDVDEITLTHVVYLTKPPYQSQKTSIVVSRDHIYQVFDEIHEIVQDMVSAKEKQVGEMEKNKSHCFSYGKRCPYFKECQISANTIRVSQKQIDILNVLRGEKKQDTLEDIIERLKNG